MNTTTKNTENIQHLIKQYNNIRDKILFQEEKLRLCRSELGKALRNNGEISSTGALIINVKACRVKSHKRQAFSYIRVSS